MSAENQTLDQKSLRYALGKHEDADGLPMHKTPVNQAAFVHSRSPKWPQLAGMTQYYWVLRYAHDMRKWTILWPTVLKSLEGMSAHAYAGNQPFDQPAIRLLRSLNSLCLTAEIKLSA
jgi:hypothetical protein